MEMSVKSNNEIKKAKKESWDLLNWLFLRTMEVAEKVVPLYDTIDNFFFQDVDYSMVRSVSPQWMLDTGRTPESSIDKTTYEQFRLAYSDPISNRMIHLTDVHGLLVALQDRIVAVRNYLSVIYKYLPAYCLYDDSEYDTCSRSMDDTADIVHTTINNVFVTLCSAFDLFTKVVYECSHYDVDGFADYKRMKSRKNSILFKKGNYGFEELKEEGLLFSEPVCVRTVCSFRDEFVHNGSWDFRCSIYYPVVDGVHVEPFVMMPDVDNSGFLVSSGSRNKFYSKGDKINVLLPGLVKDVLEVLSKTILKFKEVLENNTHPISQKEREDNAFNYMKLALKSSCKMLDIFKKKKVDGNI